MAVRADPRPSWKPQHPRIDVAIANDSGVVDQRQSDILRRRSDKDPRPKPHNIRAGTRLGPV